MLSILLGMAFGIFGGCIVAVVSACIPAYLNMQWRKDAHEFLSLPYTQTKNTKPLKIRDLINSRQALITLVCAGVCTTTTNQLGLTAQAFVTCTLALTLIAIAVIDFETLYIPDIIVLPVIWAGLLFHSITTPDQAHIYVVAAAVGYCSMRLLPIGRGDAKLCAGAGAWLGTKSLFTYFMIGSIFGVVLGIAYYLLRGKSEKYPFGPALVASFLVTAAMQTMNFQLLKLW